MTGARDFRRCALQALYQFDAVRLTSEPTEAALELVRETLSETAPAADMREEGFRLACSAWQFREAADELIAPLTPEWPIHRQPVIDRNILRLAHYELTHTQAPARVIITEAIELAREFSTENSPAFVNGVLDQVTRQVRADELGPDESTPGGLAPVDGAPAGLTLDALAPNGLASDGLASDDGAPAMDPQE